MCVCVCVCVCAPYNLRKENHCNESIVDTGLFQEGFKETKLMGFKETNKKWWYV